ncbi:mycothiol transferase [Nesterenkonia suensis]
MPFLTAEVTDERDACAIYAVQQLEQLRIAALDLDDAQLRAAPTAGALSMGGLIAHVAQTVVRWLHHVYVHGVAEPDSGLAEEAFALGFDGFWTGEEVPEETGTQLRDRLATARDLVRPVLADADFDARVPIPEAPWFPKELESWNVRWVAHHLVAEVARHAGHADIIREHLDGQIAYALNARDVGETFDWAEYAG